MRWRGFSVSLAAGLALASCGEKPAEPAGKVAEPAGKVAEPALATVAGITLSDAKVQMPVVQGRPGAAYFTISQASGAPRRIVGVTVELTGKVELHRTMTRGAISSMRPLSEVALEPGKTIRFEQGGNHAMLFDVDPRLRFQDTVRLTVALDDGSRLEARAAVVTAGDGLEHAH